MDGLLNTFKFAHTMSVAINFVVAVQHRLITCTSDNININNSISFQFLETSVRVLLTSNVETAFPLDALQRQIPSTVMFTHSLDVRSGLA